MKALDPQKCPKQITILDALCEIADKSGSAVLIKQLCAALQTARPNLWAQIRELKRKGYVSQKSGGYNTRINHVVKGLKFKCRSPDRITPLYRSNGEPYKRDMSLAEPVKTRGTKTICEPGYARGYKISPVTVRPTAPYKPSTEGMW